MGSFENNKAAVLCIDMINKNNNTISEVQENPMIAEQQPDALEQEQVVQATSGITEEDSFLKDFDKPRGFGKSLSEAEVVALYHKAVDDQIANFPELFTPFDGHQAIIDLVECLGAGAALKAAQLDLQRVINKGHSAVIGKSGKDIAFQSTCIIIPGIMAHVMGFNVYDKGSGDEITNLSELRNTIVIIDGNHRYDSLGDFRLGDEVKLYAIYATVSKKFDIYKTLMDMNTCAFPWAGGEYMVGVIAKTGDPELMRIFTLMNCGYTYTAACQNVTGMEKEISKSDLVDIIKDKKAVSILTTKAAVYRPIHDALVAKFGEGDNAPQKNKQVMAAINSRWEKLNGTDLTERVGAMVKFIEGLDPKSITTYSVTEKGKVCEKACNAKKMGELMDTALKDYFNL